MYQYKDPRLPSHGKVASIRERDDFVTSDKRVEFQARRAEKQKHPKGTENVDIVGTLVLDCLIESQIFKIKCKIEGVRNEIDKLETLLKESKNEKTLSDYDDFIRACRFLR